MAQARRGEVRVIYVLIVLVVVGAIAVVVLAFTGYVAVGWLNQKNLNQMVNEGVDSAAGYTAAKTPTEAMDKFREAIQARNYRAAKKYVTKDYGEMLERAHTAAKDIGAKIDRIREFGKNNGILTDKTALFLYRLDAFPKNFGSDKPPEMKGDKAYGKYKWEPPVAKGVPPDQVLNENKNLDADMYQTVLAPPLIFHGTIELIKEGDDWKLNIPTNPQWETAVAYYIDHYKTHDTGLEAMVTSMTRDRYENPASFESAVFEKLRAAKK